MEITLSIGLRALLICVFFLSSTHFLQNQMPANPITLDDLVFSFGTKLLGLPAIAVPNDTAIFYILDLDVSGFSGLVIHFATDNLLPFRFSSMIWLLNYHCS